MARCASCANPLKQSSEGLVCVTPWCPAITHVTPIYPGASDAKLAQLAQAVAR
jgi:hypothetical protein